MNIKAYWATSSTSPIAPLDITRREVWPHDVLVDIMYCGVCHSDIHQARSERGQSVYPIVPWHEIVGRVSAIGDQVTKFNIGDLAGIGVFVDSCRSCHACSSGLEQYCDQGMTGTYGWYYRDEVTPTYGWYSKQYVIDQSYALHLPFTEDQLPWVAPLLCAGITTYSPLRYVWVWPGHRVAVLGLGGLGHMAVKFAASFGAEVTMLSRSPDKEADAKLLWAHHFVLTSDTDQMKSLVNHFDFILDTVSAPHDMNMCANLLRLDGKMLLVWIPSEDHHIHAATLIGKRRSLVWSMIGGIAETQEMLDYCAQHNILSEVEIISADQINTAYDRILASDVKYRFVIDINTL